MRRGAVAAIALAGLAGVGTLSGAPSSAAPTNPDAAAILDSPDCVKPLPLVKVMAVQPDGKQVAPHDGDGLGRAYFYGELGDTMQLFPPTDFSPLTATDQELAAYGFEARPKDPALLPHWRSLYANYHYAGPTAMCETNRFTISPQAPPIA